ncbi:bifunctional diguanylate cyclase/phosphodiesterase [Psychrobacillus sp.]|uniref:putative bifunctional diguanylate cyclase/phosphodiesterase n=1 Tax=Psychrobacillus sp. TaxID=1871623 RepID=UPI0028BE5D64|nr:bifunctional diguanylate cyclase/phosphodiesterase [Psychrobacillus sp.]
MLKNTYRHISFKIVIIYAISGLLWILMADILLSPYFSDKKIVTIIQGLIYVVLSSLLLLFLMRQSWKMQKDLTIKEYMDDLTGLPNRTTLQARLSTLVQNQERFHLLFIDFDRFKMINDLYGHDSGDKVLKEVSSRLKNASYIDHEDALARWGADEFIIILKNRSHQEIDKITKDVLVKLALPIAIGDQEIISSISIGSVHCPADSTNAKELLRFAELAVGVSKKNGGLTHCRFEKSMSEEVNRTLYLEEGLKKALEKEELFLNYQPQILAETHEIVGVESLIRWNYGGTIISPGEFIPIAEKTDQIIKIGDFVLRETCRNIRQIERAVGKELIFSVNVSARQFYQIDYIERTKQILTDMNIHPNKIVLEITESIIMEYTEFVIESLQELKNYGFQIAIDDFGTGYSSFKYLELLPVNIIKIDQSFTQAIEKERSKAIVQSIISLAHNLNLKVLAEGVEDLYQIASLSEFDCHYLQGYFFSKPLAFEQLIAEYKSNL